MYISITDLRKNVVRTLEKHLSADQAAQVADILLWADMSGITTHGIAKLLGNQPLQDIEPAGAITIERDTKLSQLIDANAWPAPLVCEQAADTAAKKAAAHGFGIVGVHNTFSSSGALAYYAERIARQNLIGIVMARSSGGVAPFGSIDGLFSANPIAFSFPTMQDPLIFDMATSAMTWSGLVLAKTRGEKLPENIAIDPNGSPTTDPDVAMKGSILPFDNSYKSSGLGLVVEIMAGPLAASAYCDSETFDKQWGNTLIAIDPGLLVDPEAFKAHCSDLIAKIKHSRKRPDVTDIRLPGERSLAARKHAEKTGMVKIDDTILRKLDYL